MPRTDVLVRHDHHDVRVRGEEVDEGREVRVAHFHALKLRLGLAAAQFELLDDVADLLEAVGVTMVCVRGVRDHEERRALKQHDLVGVADRAEIVQMLLKVLHVWDQRVHDRRPRAVERLIQDRRAKADRRQRTRARQHHLLLLLKDLQ